MLNTYGMDTQDFFRLAMRHLLGESSLTQGAVAEHLGIAKTTVNDFLNKRRNFPDAKREAIAEFFGTSHIDMLILGRQLSKGRVPAQADATGTVEHWHPNALPPPPHDVIELSDVRNGYGRPDESEGNEEDGEDAHEDRTDDRKVSDLPKELQAMIRMWEQLDPDDLTSVRRTTQERDEVRRMKKEMALLRTMVSGKDHKQE